MRQKNRQREFGFVTWGGKRRGAGRKPKGERAGVSHVTRPKLKERHPVLVTLRLRAGLRSLRYDDEHELLKKAFAAASQGGSFRIVEYSIQSNHLHLLVESTNVHALSRGMAGLAVRIARSLNRLWKRVGRVFADRYHSRILETPRAVRNALLYLLQNARKHGAWRARSPDVYSSGPTFDGWKGGERNSADSRATRLLSRARTWLLSVGWRRHGLLDPRELPAGCT